MKKKAQRRRPWLGEIGGQERGSALVRGRERSQQKGKKKGLDLERVESV